MRVSEYQKKKRDWVSESEGNLGSGVGMACDGERGFIVCCCWVEGVGRKQWQ